MDVALLSVSRLCRLRPLLGAVSRNLSTGTFVNPNNAKERKESDNSLAYVSCFPPQIASVILSLRSLTKMRHKATVSLHW